MRPRSFPLPLAGGGRGWGLSLALLLLAAVFVTTPAHATSLRFCGQSPAITAAEQSRLLRVTAVVRELLHESGSTVALISRAGQQQLTRFGQRYSHMGVALAASPNTPWSVRQLYYDCDASQARLFDEGLAGFLMGLDNPRQGFISLVFLPREAGAALEARALDQPHALALLGSAYSANAYPFDTRFQNCNQWVAELLATAWGALPAGEVAAGASPRERAQAALRALRYEPTTLTLSTRWWLVAAAFVPWVHTADHPSEDLDALRMRLSLPAGVEAFVRQQHPAAERFELCHDERQVVLRRSWRSMGEGCAALPGDRVIPLD